MKHISKHFTCDNYDQLVLKKEEYSDQEWKLILKIFGLDDADQIVVSEYKLEAW